jgi:hypothetical protein
MLSIQPRSSRPSVFARNASAFAVFACASALGAHAQQIVQPPAGSADSSAPLFASVSNRPMDMASLAGVNYSSSSSPSDADAALPADPGTLILSGSGLQPPPRRHYGSPRYNDNMHNADGSNKWTFVGAVGLTLPTGNTYHYFNTNYAFQVGGGRNFNKRFGVLAQFDYDHFGINGATLNNQSTIYNTDLGFGIPVDGNNHIWSFTLNPIYNFYQADKVGAYVVGGVGFYHKVTNFVTPETEQVLTFFGPEDFTANEVFDHYTSNAPGFNGGFGLTYKFSRFADERFFAEARYVFIDNSQRTGLTVADSTTPPYGTTANPGSTYTGSNFFPANSNRTTYIPVKVGIRF